MKLEAKEMQMLNYLMIIVQLYLIEEWFTD